MEVMTTNISTANHRTHANLRITGHVQGVFFRISAKKYADALGLSGYVQNNFDGSVTIEIEGNEDSINQFVDWAHMGPARAEVEDVSVEFANPQWYDMFEVR